MFAEATFHLELRLNVWYPLVPMQDPNDEESKELNNED
jgi:hypothetical protein